MEYTIKDGIMDTLEQNDIQNINKTLETSLIAFLVLIFSCAFIGTTLTFFNKRSAKISNIVIQSVICLLVFIEFVSSTLLQETILHNFPSEILNTTEIKNNLRCCYFKSDNDIISSKCQFHEFCEDKLTMLYNECSLKFSIYSFIIFFLSSLNLITSISVYNGMFEYEK